MVTNEMTRQSASQATWFVGAAYDTDDQTSRFLEEGIWENGYEDKYLDLVRSVRPGDRIAIKSSYTRKHDLPFDNRGQTVSVMAIKAIGTVTENLNDGKQVRVNWKRADPVREWYFYTHRGTIWRVLWGRATLDLLSGNPILQGRDKGAETAPEIQSTACRDKMRARIPASSGLFAMNREISVCARLRGGPGRTRTANQIVMKLSRRGPSAACLGAYATAPGRFFGHNADTKSQPPTSVRDAITSA
jgi:hypothetical protein